MDLYNKVLFNIHRMELFDFEIFVLYSEWSHFVINMWEYIVWSFAKYTEAKCVSYCTVLYSTVLCSTQLYCTVLHSITLAAHSQPPASLQLRSLQSGGLNEPDVLPWTCWWSPQSGSWQGWPPASQCWCWWWAGGWSWLQDTVRLASLGYLVHDGQ